MKKISLPAICGFVLMLTSCDNPATSPAPPRSTDDPDGGTTPVTSSWNIPEKEIVFGGVEKDGIPSLFNPETIPAEEADYLSDDDLVVGLVFNGEPRAYPHTILDWHEVVNEQDGDQALTVSYCPLTGSAIVFDGFDPEINLEFGVSGLLFNNNLIMFDRATDSHWPQMRLQCDEGILRNRRQVVIPALETTWGNWKKLHPNTAILSIDTGFVRPYRTPGSAYPGYDRLDSPIFFPLSSRDKRLPLKRRVHGILTGQGPDAYKAKVYPIRESQEPRLINDLVGNLPVLVIDVGRENFITSFVRIVNDQPLSFELESAPKTFPFTVKDRTTQSTWNVLGEAVDGPLTGTKLERPLAYNAYWFAWAVFYENTEVFNR